MIYPYPNANTSAAANREFAVAGRDARTETTFNATAEFTQCSRVASRVRRVSGAIAEMTSGDSAEFDCVPQPTALIPLAAERSVGFART